jgi:membrane-associated phospholipid phosphatase
MIGVRVVLRPLDRLFIGLNCLFVLLYLAALLLKGADGLSMLMIFLFFVSIPAALFLILAAEKSSSRFLHWLRFFYPQGMFILYFTQSIRLSRIYHPVAFDAPVARFEEFLFGGRPVLAFFEGFPRHPVLNELFFFAYFSFYLFLTLPWWVLYFQGKKREAEESLFILIASFSLLYVWYIVFPVEGPKFFYPELRALWYDHFSGGLFTMLMKQLFTPSTMAGAALPSSHVAMGLLALLLSLRHARLLGRLLVPVYLLLVLSTVYLYTHYLVDILAGLAYGAAAFLLVPRFTARFYTSPAAKEALK